MGSNTDARFEALYRAHVHEVHGYCLRRTSTEEAKDATSEVFVVAWHRFDDVPDGDESLPWLYGVARNVLANALDRFADVSGSRRELPLTIIMRYLGQSPSSYATNNTTNCCERCFFRGGVLTDK